jgi:hypothetical protein
MGNIFRTATKQAILDLIADHGTRSRFGQMLSDDDADQLAARVVDLFEMTLELRGRTGMLGLGSAPAAKPSAESNPNPRRRSPGAAAEAPTEKLSWSDTPPRSTFPTTIHAAEFLEKGDRKARVSDATAETPDPTFMGLKLPRQRKPITEAERQSFMKRR